MEQASEQINNHHNSDEEVAVDSATDAERHEPRTLTEPALDADKVQNDSTTIEPGRNDPGRSTNALANKNKRHSQTTTVIGALETPTTTSLHQRHGGQVDVYDDYNGSDDNTDQYNEGGEYWDDNDRHPAPTSEVHRRPSQSSRRGRPNKRRRSPSSSPSSDTDSESSEEEKRKKKKKHSHKRRSSTSSSSPDRRKKNKSRRLKKKTSQKLFTISCKKEENAWGLKKELADHINHHARTFIKDRDLQEQILEAHPVPSNITEPPQLDNVVKASLERAHKDTIVKKDKALLRSQNKIRDSLGPLARVSALMEDFKNSRAEKKYMDVGAVSEALEQTHILLGQAQVSLIYTRRLETLTALTGSHKEAKKLLHENAQALEDTDSENELLGKNFRKQMKETKAEEDRHEDLFKKTTHRPMQPGKHRPFRAGPPPRRPGGGQQPYHGPPRTSYDNGRGRGTKGKSFKHSPGHNCPTTTKECGHDTSTGKVGTIQKCPPFSVKSTPTLSRSRKPTLCRKIKILPRAMAKNNERQGNSRHNLWMGNSFHRDSHNKTSEKSPNDTGREDDSHTGNRNNARERGNQGSVICTRTNPVQSFSKRKKGWVTKTHTQLEKTQFVHSLPTFQNGRIERCKKSPERKRLDGQNRPEGCILHSSSQPQIPETCKVSMGRENLPILMPLLWPGSSTTTVHKSHEDTTLNASTTEHKTGYIPGRPSDLRGNTSGNNPSEGHSIILVGESRLCNKLEEVHTNTGEQNGILGCNNRQYLNDHNSDRGENFVPHENGSEHIDFRKADIKETRQPNWETGGHCSGNNAMYATSKIPTTTTYSRTEIPELRENSVLRWEIENRTNMVDGKPQGHNGETNKIIPSRPNNRIRCSNLRRMGSNLQRNLHGGTVEPGRKELAHKPTGIQSSGPSNKDLHQNAPLSETHPPKDRQHNGTGIPSENGGYEKQGSHREIQIPLGIPTIKRDHSYSRIPPLRIEHRSRLPLQECERLERMDALPQNIQSNMQQTRDPRYGPICIQNITPTEALYEPQTRPRLQSSRCSPTKLVSPIPLCFPPIQPYWQSAKESPKRSDVYDPDHTHMDNPTLVPNAAGNDNPTAITTSKTPGNTDRPYGEPTPSHSERVTFTGSMANIRTTMADKNLSGQATDLITKSRAAGTRYNYNAAWKKFCGWCNLREVDPFYCTISYIINFLASLFEEGLQYRTINVYRSAISFYHNKVDGKPTGENRDICDLLKGISNERPPTPRYCNTWDVNEVLQFLTSWGHNSSLSTKNLTLKTTFLLAITSMHRGAELRSLKLHLKNEFEKYIVFQLDTKPKNCKQGRTLPTSEFHKFTDPVLCPMRCLKKYLQVTEEWRTRDTDNFPTPNQLFLSHISPHNPVTKATIGRWLKDLLGLANIDIFTYKGHSTRTAAAAKAEALGLSIEEIVTKGNWAGTYTFKKFYQKPIVSTQEKFQKTILHTPL